MAWLRAMRLDAAIASAVSSGASLLGVCVGHQLLFERSAEGDDPRGLSLLEGNVTRLEGYLPVPQIGWNAVSCRGPLFDGIESGTPFYFINSYAVKDAADETASAYYGGRFTAAAQKGRVFGVQFHPEKSSSAGLRILRNFLKWN
jgi:glutamine amidotransferase